MRSNDSIAARIWMPADAETNPVPSLLEHIPYRKSDYTSLRDANPAFFVPYIIGRGSGINIRPHWVVKR